MIKKNKETGKVAEIPLPEKHSMTELPVEAEETIISEEDLDKISDEEQEETPPYEPPPSGEGP